MNGFWFAFSIGCFYAWWATEFKIESRSGHHIEKDSYSWTFRWLR